jgi:hypothetical protein
METPPSAGKPTINLTAIVIAGMVLLVALVAFVIFFLGNRSAPGGGVAFSKPPLPLALTWRETLGFGKTQVAVIHGKNDAPMQLIIEVTRSVDGRRLVLEGTLEPKGLLEVGQFQCSDHNNFVPGDQILIKNNNYSPYQETCR